MPIAMLFAALHESGFGTKRTFYACRRMSVLDGKAVMQRSTAKTDFDPNGLREHHATCLSPLVTDRAMEAWYHPSSHE
jgi:hypothetical protein